MRLHIGKRAGVFKRRRRCYASAMKSTLTLAAATLVLAASVAFAQPPQGSPAPPAGKGEQTPPAAAPTGRNLQVLPADIPQRNLMNTMQAFTAALGVNCSHCHVPGNFRSDDNPKKNIARGMMRMTWQLNNQILPAIPGLSEPRVSCTTCHRGEAVPATALPAAANATGATKQ